MHEPMQRQQPDNAGRSVLGAYAAELKESFVTVTLPDDFFDEGPDPEP